MGPLEGRTGSHDPGLVCPPSASSSSSSTATYREEWETRERRGRRGRRDRNTHREARNETSVALNAVAPERCSCGLLQG